MPKVGLKREIRELGHIPDHIKNMLGEYLTFALLAARKPHTERACRP
ncbi:MAG TPA: hypothetical protein VFI00_21020 [Kribbella sp.]|nr:hypothetical protein [Kribbella sp.]